MSSFQDLKNASGRDSKNAISNLATLSTLPPPLVALFTTAHDICMWKRCQNSVAGGGGGVICMLHTTTPLPATKCPLFQKLKYGHPTKLVDSSSTGGTCL